MTLRFDLIEDLEKPLADAGATLTGYADLGSVTGRPFPELTHGLALALAFDPFLARQPGRPLANPAYVDEYYLTRARLDQLVERGVHILRSYGYRARGYGFQPFFGDQVDDMRPTEYLIALYQHKTTAVRANLGWIGKMGVLVTKEYGPNIWLGTILTDAPLPGAEPCRKSLCGRCRRCQEACPVKAVKGVLWAPDMLREDLIDVRGCQEHRRQRGHYLQRPMCGLCLAACPLGQR